MIQKAICSLGVVGGQTISQSAVEEWFVAGIQAVIDKLPGAFYSISQLGVYLGTTRVGEMMRMRSLFNSS